MNDIAVPHCPGPRCRSARIDPDDGIPSIRIDRHRLVWAAAP
jgi:hypothetical protein